MYVCVAVRSTVGFEGGKTCEREREKETPTHPHSLTLTLTPTPLFLSFFSCHLSVLTDARTNKQQTHIYNRRMLYILLYGKVPHQMKEVVAVLVHRHHHHQNEVTQAVSQHQQRSRSQHHQHPIHHVHYPLDLHG
jgi:hypothetical protein